MKRFVVLCMLVCLAGAVRAQEVLVGMTDTASYYPLLRGRRVAVLTNHTAVAEMPGSGAPADGAGRVHLVDMLHDAGFDVRGIFAPEHGFRGTADAGEAVRGGVDAATGIPIFSLYDGRQLRPSDETMRAFDVLLVDMQDVGVRFYTYHITMLRMMDACAAFGRTVVVLDRPNPHGEKIDGPILEPKYRSGVGVLPIPVLHGLTMGEIARMAVGEGWAAPCRLTVVPCRNYTHAAEYLLPVAPSPNLPTQRAVYLYPTLCLFEGTVLSVGRGTETPFEVYGHPDMADRGFRFTPRPTPGARQPLHEGRVCRGVNLHGVPLDAARRMGLTLEPLIAAYAELGPGEGFFKPIFEKLIGTGYVREMIAAGASADEIRARWQEDLAEYRRLRGKYLLYD
ncbi:DUF1343 domain-containing protein [uncultured Alistipes sp.]|jgi:uncharacterized protein YbbC (DUF1343 family)|uniref:exo-beta-N-acetylmuramidase NamZ family protein n=1 Tax=uncultured Alistipes sp. TaxID=538949 RepID=UPI0026163457|nr:DUF1343 domain-containing protein [uncultured Alistipes sp.]